MSSVYFQKATRVMTYHTAKQPCYTFKQQFTVKDLLIILPKPASHQGKKSFYKALRKQRKASLVLKLFGCVLPGYRQEFCQRLYILLMNKTVVFLAHSILHNCTVTLVSYICSPDECPSFSQNGDKKTCEKVNTVFSHGIVLLGEASAKVSCEPRCFPLPCSLK